MVRKMSRYLYVKTAMTPFPHSIDIDADVDTARAMMDRHGVHHLPVKDGEKLVNIISVGEVTLALNQHRTSGHGVKPLVRDLCVSEVYIVDLNEQLDQVLMHMANHHIHSAVVVRKGKLAGIFTATDAYRGFGELLRSRYPTRGGDDAA